MKSRQRLALKQEERANSVTDEERFTGREKTKVVIGTGWCLFVFFFLLLLFLLFVVLSLLSLSIC
jgi:hypothetical protein